VLPELGGDARQLRRRHPQPRNISGDDIGDFEGAAGTGDAGVDAADGAAADFRMAGEARLPDRPVAGVSGWE